MAYSIHALIGKKPAADFLVGLALRAIPLPQDFYLIPLDDAKTKIRDSFPTHMAGDDDELRPRFGQIPPSIEEIASQASNMDIVAYIEAEYFGGQGASFGLLWRNGRRSPSDTFISINTALAELGVIRTIDQDEFDTLALGRHRNTSQWR